MHLDSLHFMKKMVVLVMKNKYDLPPPKDTNLYFDTMA